MTKLYLIKILFVPLQYPYAEDTLVSGSGHVGMPECCVGYHIWKRRLSDALFLTTESLGNLKIRRGTNATIDAHGYEV